MNTYRDGKNKQINISSDQGLDRVYWLHKAKC